MVGLDALLCLAAYYGAYFIRFEVVSRKELMAFAATVVWVVPLKLVLLFSFKMYRGMWRYTGIHDLLNLLKALSVATGLVVFGVLSFYRFEGFSRGVFVIDFLFSVIFLGGYRLGIRILAGYVRGKELGNGSDTQPVKLKRLVIYRGR